MLFDQTLNHLTDLKLTGMKLALQQQREQPKTHNLSFEERLGLLVDYEKTYHKDKKIDRLTKAAKLRQQACVEDIDYNHPRGFKREDISSFVSCKWIKQAFNLLITGPTGAGKSWIACALEHQACRMGLSVHYIRLLRLLEELRLAHVDGSYAKVANRLLKFDLLILDDWGLDRLNQAQRRDSLEITEDRHTLKSLMITSQLPIEKCGDPTVADAILDRVLNKSLRLEVRGESMRKAEKNIAALTVFILRFEHAVNTSTSVHNHRNTQHISQFFHN